MAWRITEQARERSGHVGLVGEAHSSCDFGNAASRVQQQPLGYVETPRDQILMWRKSARFLQGAREALLRQAHHACHVAQRKRLVEPLVDIRLDALEFSVVKLARFPFHLAM